MAEEHDIDEAILDAAQTLVVGSGLPSLTIDRLAEAAGTSRMTLHRRGVKRRAVVDALVARAGQAYADALWPALTSSGNGAARLTMALNAICSTADDNLALLAGLFGEPDSPFHQSPSRDGGRETGDLFVAPLARLLRDGALDESIPVTPDPEETASVLFNLVGWGYIHLRYAQAWPAKRARPAVTAFALAAVGVAPG